MRRPFLRARDAFDIKLLQDSGAVLSDSLKVHLFDGPAAEKLENPGFIADRIAQVNSRTCTPELQPYVGGMARHNSHHRAGPTAPRCGTSRDGSVCSKKAWLSLRPATQLPLSICSGPLEIPDTDIAISPHGERVRSKVLSALFWLTSAQRLDEWGKSRANTSGGIKGQIYTIDNP